MHKLLLASMLLICGTAALAEEIKLAHGDIRLNANLEKADGNWSAGPVVLMTHGTLAHNGMEIMAGMQGMLAERGLSSLAITLSLGLDDRHGMYDCKTPHVHKHTDAMDEIGLWLEWLKGQGAEKVVLLGHSRGGNQTARFAASHPDPVVVAVILLAPQTWTADYDAADYEKRYGVPLQPVLDKAKALQAEGKGSALMENVDFIYCADTSATADAFVSYYGPNQNMDTPHVIPGIEAPVLVFSGSDDSSVAGLVEKTELLADGERVRLVVVDGADHFFRDLYSEDVADTVAEMFEE